MARKIGELFYELRASSESLSRDLKESERQFGKFAQFIKANPVAAATGLAVAFAGIAFAASKAAGEIEKEMNQVNALLGSSREGAEQLQADMVAVASATGESQREISKLFKTIAENGPGGAEKIKVIADAAIALSQVLGGDFSANAQGLDAVTDIFNIDGTKAREIAAALFQISSGRVPLQDLLGVIAKVGPDVAALGIDFETTASAITVLLDQGYSVKRVASTIKELTDRGAEGRVELVRLAGASIDTAAAMNRLNDEQDRAQRTAEATANRIKNELNSAWLEFGNKTLPLVAAGLSFVVGWMEGAGDASVKLANGAVRAKAALDAMNRGAIENKSVLSFTVTTNGLGGSQIQSPRQRSASEIGERLADVITATRRLSELTATQLRANDRELASLEKLATNDSQLEKIKKLRTEIGDALPEALKRMSAETKRAAKEIESLMSKADALAVAFDGQSAVERARLQIEKWAEEAKAAGLPAETIRVEVERLNAALARMNAREAATQVAEFAKSLQERATALRESMQTEAAAIEGEKKSSAARQKTVQDLGDEIAAREAGGKVLEEYLRAKEREAIITAQVAEAEQRAKNAKRDVTAEEIAAAKQLGNQIADANERIEQLKTQAGGSGLLTTFASLAREATSIATSLGTGGEGLARMAAIIGPLLSGLSGVNNVLSKLGKGVPKGEGFIDTLGGKYGKNNQAEALASSVAIAGVFIGIADSLDLFGTHAKERAREVAEAAKRFDAGLKDFVDAAYGNNTAVKGALKQAYDDFLSLFAELVTKYGDAAAVTRDGSLELLAIQRAYMANLLRVGREFLGSLDDAYNGLTGRDDLVQLSQAQRDYDTRLQSLFQLLQQGAITQDEYDAAVIRSGEILTLTTQKIQEAATRLAGLRELDDTLAVLGGTPFEQLTTSLASLTKLFPQFAGLFDELKLSTKEGLEAAREKLRAMFRVIAEDGISEAEQPIVDVIRRILGGIDAVIASLPDIDPMARALEAFAVRVEVFGLSAKEQLDGLIEIFSGAFDALDPILSGADTASTAGLQAFADSIRAQIGTLLEGGITDEEAPFLAALRQLLGAVTGELEDIANQVERDRQALVSGTQQNVENSISINGLSGGAAFQSRVQGLAGLSPAFASLLPLFSDTSAAGIEASQAALRALFRSIQDGTIDLEQFGAMTKDEVIAAIISLNGELGGLAGSLTTAAQAAAQAAAAEREATADLRIRSAKARGEDTRLAEFDDNARRQREQAVAEDRSLAFRNYLDQVLADERRKLVNDIATEAANAAESSTASTLEAKKNTPTELVQNVGSITEVSAQTMVSVLRQIEANTRTLAQAFANGLPAPPRVFSGPLTGSASLGATINFYIAAPSIPITSAAAAAGLGSTYGRAAATEISKALGKLTAIDVRFLGGGVR